MDKAIDVVPTPDLDEEDDEKSEERGLGRRSFPPHLLPRYYQNKTTARTLLLPWCCKPDMGPKPVTAGGRRSC